MEDKFQVPVITWVDAKSTTLKELDQELWAHLEILDHATDRVRFALADIIRLREQVEPPRVDEYRLD